MASVKKGDWVQIENIVLPAGQRAPQVPEDTQACDLKLWVKGIAQQDGEMGDEYDRYFSAYRFICMVISYF